MKGVSLQGMIAGAAMAALAVSSFTPAHAKDKAAPANAYQAAVDAAYAKFKDTHEGKNADYIPALAKVDPNVFGVALVTGDGKVYTAGDLTTEVSIQSISKVFTMALVMQEQGPDAIYNNIGVDATGMRFNSIVSVEQSKKMAGGPEMNALVNPGAITATSMVQGATRDEIWNKILAVHSDCAGRQLGVLKDVYDSEAATNQRNQAIGMLMYAYEYIKAEPLRAVDIYTKQCSVGVTAKDLAVMASTLAFGGVNPVCARAQASTGPSMSSIALMPDATTYCSVASALWSGIWR